MKHFLFLIASISLRLSYNSRHTRASNVIFSTFCAPPFAHAQCRKLCKSQKCASDKKSHTACFLCYVAAKTIAFPIESCYTVTSKFISVNCITQCVKMKVSINLFCTCRMPESFYSKMIKCDQLADWLHFKCVGLKKNNTSANRMCTRCSLST